MGKSGSVHTTSNGILPPCQNLEKINHTLSKKHPDRWKDGRTHRRMEGRREELANPIL